MCTSALVGIPFTLTSLYMAGSRVLSPFLRQSVGTFALVSKGLVGSFEQCLRKSLLDFVKFLFSSLFLI